MVAEAPAFLSRNRSDLIQSMFPPGAVIDKLNTPFSIGVDGPSGSCPLGCEDCMDQLVDDSGAREVSFTQVKGQIDRLKKAGFEHIILGHSESTLWDDFIPALKYIKEQGLSASCITSGIALTADLLSQVDGLVTKLIISIDEMHVKAIERYNRVSQSRALTHLEVFGNIEALGDKFKGRIIVNTTVTFDDLKALQGDASASSMLPNLRNFLIDRNEYIDHWNLIPLCGEDKNLIETGYQEVIHRMIGKEDNRLPFAIGYRYPYEDGYHWLHATPKGSVNSLYFTHQNDLVDLPVALIGSKDLTSVAQTLGYLS